MAWLLTSFRRVRAALAPGGRFVLGDVIVPEEPSDTVTPIDGDYDTPSTIAEQTLGLQAAGFTDSRDLEPPRSRRHRRRSSRDGLSARRPESSRGHSPTSRIQEH